jgi:hypothetical protein
MMLGLGALRALGTDYRIDCSGGSTNGQTIDCDLWSNIFNSTCWGMCSAQVLATGEGAPPPVAQTTGLCAWIPSLCTTAGVLSTAAIAGISVVAVGAVLLLSRGK